MVCHNWSNYMNIAIGTVYVQINNRIVNCIATVYQSQPIKILFSACVCVCVCVCLCV